VYWARTTPEVLAVTENEEIGCSEENVHLCRQKSISMIIFLL
jgi:hypothetical protein